MNVPSFEEVKSELAAVKERISETKDRIDRLERQRLKFREERYDAEIRNQKEKLAQANQKVEQREKSLIRAKNALKQLKASREAFTARVRAGEQDDNDLSMAHLSVLQRKRALQRLMEIAEGGPESK